MFRLLLPFVKLRCTMFTANLPERNKQTANHFLFTTAPSAQQTIDDINLSPNTEENSSLEDKEKTSSKR